MNLLRIARAALGIAGATAAGCSPAVSPERGAQLGGLATSADASGASTTAATPTASAATAPVAAPSDAGGASVDHRPIDATAAALAAVKTIDPPAAGACALSGKPADAIALRAAPGGRLLARAWLDRADAKLLPAGGLYVDAESSGVRVHGYVDDTSIVHPSRALVFGGFLVASIATDLHVRAGDGGKMTATLSSNAGVAPATPLALEVTCDDLSLGRAMFDARAALPKAKREGNLFLTDKELALAATPGGPAVARVRIADTPIEVLEDRAGLSRIVAPVSVELVFGWVSAAAVRKLTAADAAARMSIGVIGATEGGVGPGSSPPDDERVCDAELPLIAAAGGDRYSLGTLKRGARLRVLERDPSLTRVALAGSTARGFSPEPATALLVPTRELAACARANTVSGAAGE